MSLSQALQERKRQAAPSALTSSSLPFGNSNRAGAKESVAWSIGDIAIHKKWGEGTVLEVSGSGSTQELKINFPEVGLKKLLASVAPFQIINNQHLFRNLKLLLNETIEKNILELVQNRLRLFAVRKASETH